jgi:hypothetical protein
MVRVEVNPDARKSRPLHLENFFVKVLASGTVFYSKEN